MIELEFILINFSLVTDRSDSEMKFKIGEFVVAIQDYIVLHEHNPNEGIKKNCIYRVTYCDTYYIKVSKNWRFFPLEGFITEIKYRKLQYNND